MKNLIFSLFAVALAGIAAIAATTAMLNTPVHTIAPVASDKKPESTTPGGTTTGGTTPGNTTPASTPAPSTPAPSADKPAEDEKDDKDPYEGIAPEELPPDLQYDADASVSFPTNT